MYQAAAATTMTAAAIATMATVEAATITRSSVSAAQRRKNAALLRAVARKGRDCSEDEPVTSASPFAPASPALTRLA
jgi:hypothetical protein